MEQTAPKPRGRPGRKPSQLKQIQSTESMSAQEQPVNVTAPTEPATTSLDRPSIRPPMREDSRAAAARRAEEILQNLGGNLEQGNDEFSVPNAPDGWVYEWKMKSIFGQEDPGRYAANLGMGWEHVPADRHPELMPNQKDAAIVERKGNYLMMRPKSINDLAIQRDKTLARQQMQQKNQQLAEAPAGHFDRDHPSVRPRVNTSFSPIPVPGDK